MFALGTLLRQRSGFVLKISESSVIAHISDEIWVEKLVWSESFRDVVPSYVNVTPSRAVLVAVGCAAT